MFWAQDPKCKVENLKQCHYTYTIEDDFEDAVLRLTTPIICSKRMSSQVDESTFLFKTKIVFG